MTSYPLIVHTFTQVTTKNLNTEIGYYKYHGIILAARRKPSRAGINQENREKCQTSASMNLLIIELGSLRATNT